MRSLTRLTVPHLLRRGRAVVRVSLGTFACEGGADAAEALRLVPLRARGGRRRSRGAALGTFACEGGADAAKALRS
eukprot:171785-Chlamydomonas_euryale.AAC.1